MTWPELYLLCFAIGVLWSVAALLLGGLHVGHAGSAQGGHAAPAHIASGHGAHLHGAAGRGQIPVGKAAASDLRWFASMVNPSCAAIFLAWFGGIGYLLTRHSGLGFWINLAIAIAAGLTGAWLLAAFLRYLQSRESPLDPADYDMIGVLGQVSSTIRPDGIGEVIYVRDGARKLVPARSEEGQQIATGEEVVVTRYEKGIAYVRTWDAMTQPAHLAKPESFQKETKNVE